MKIEQHIRYWLRAAASDFETAETLLKTRKNLHYCLFFCHLTIEKNLKATIVRRRGTMPPRSHDLEYLSEKAGLELPNDVRDFLTEMNGFNLEAHYPDEKFEIYKKSTPALARKYFQRTREFVQWLQHETTQ